ncbi:hypothetical protein NNJEOMEG_00542 [Fundidesulfovibrio magnetotacticus]|uniref:Glycosyltransferase RgtA/B/C/D-like domain-containing protein n=1 Tax=Fundidesulfovibrio magnetotacticus TaxID=2730080 RepID=A0A6V8LWR0_9BACT|nr:hypothetical protein [Fundidesulfovibrio magnetotacticus]GFK92715.1 hypothetical protein NNJEOMEG_00542 [Fundidesulfovibrio magnetotacticus]
MDGYSFRSLRWWGLAVLTSLACAALPYALGTLWLKASFGFDRAQYLALISDSIHYWHETLNMARVPLDTGFYGYQETHAPLGRYGVHAPWVILVYALGVKLFGAASTLPITLNAWLFGLAILAYQAITRARGIDMAALVALCALYGPFQLGLAWIFPDMLNVSLVVVLAAMARRALNDEGDRPFFWGMLAVSIPMVLIRKSWLPLLPLFVALHFMKHRRVWKSYYLATAFAALTTWAAYTYATAPYHFAETLQFFKFTDLFRGGMEQFSKMVSYSATSLLHIHREMFYGNLFGLTILAASLAGAATSLLRRRLGEALFLLLTPLTAFLYIFGHFFNGIIAVRHLSAVFLLGLMTSVLGRQKTLYALFLVANLILYPAFLEAFQKLTLPEYAASGVHEALAELRPILAREMVHTAGGDPWLNTVATQDYYRSLLALPPGFAFNAVRPQHPSFKPPLRSRYVLLSDPELFLPLFPAPPRLILRTFDGAYLYENTGAASQAKDTQ